MAGGGEEWAGEGDPDILCLLGAGYAEGMRMR